MESEEHEHPNSSDVVCQKWRCLFPRAKPTTNHVRNRGRSTNIWAVTAQDTIHVESFHVRMEEDLHWWTSLLFILSTFGTPTSKILVPECGVSEIITKLHDSGYTNIASIRSSDMIRKMTHLVCRPSFAWRNLDIFHDTIKLGDGGFDFVVDNGVLDSLGSSITKYLFKVVELLNCGGKYIVFMSWNACDAAKAKLLSCLRSLLEFFSKGWKIILYQVSQTTLGFNVVLEKTAFDYTSWITGYDFLQDVEPDIFEVLKDDQDRKRGHCISMAWNYNDVLNGAVGNIHSLSIGRCFCFSWTNTRCQTVLTYRAIVLDVIPPVEKYALDVFLVPKPIFDLPPSQTIQEVVTTHSEASRVVLVLLDDFLDTLTIKEHQANLLPLTRMLAQWKNVCRYARVLKEELLTPLERKDDGEVDGFATGDMTGFNVTSPAILSVSADKGTTFYINEDEGKTDRSDAMLEEHEKQCSPQLKASPSRSTITYISATKVIMVYHEYETSLTDWLDDTPVRWLKENDKWNKYNLRLQCKVDKASGWNSSRPIEECGMVISGLITAVCNLHAKGKSHGDLRNPDNYLMSYMDCKIGGTKEKVVYVYLRPCEGSDQGEESMKQDYLDLIYLVFDKILEGHELPRLWDDFKASISYIASHLEVVDDKMVAAYRRIIENHPACWRWCRRYEYYENLWMVEHQRKSVSKGKMLQIIEGTDIGVLNWMDCVPVGTPLERVLLSGSYTSKKLDLYKYIRTVKVHLYDESPWAKFVFKTDCSWWGKSRFVEVVLSECFPNHLNKIYKGLEVRDVRI